MLFGVAEVCFIKFSLLPEYIITRYSKTGDTRYSSSAERLLSFYWVPKYHRLITSFVISFLIWSSSTEINAAARRRHLSTAL